MKRIITLSVILSLISGFSLAADQVLTVTIPDAKVAYALEGFLKIHPNDEVDGEGSPIYTNREWIEECIRRFIVREVNRGQNMIYQESKPVPDDATATRQ